MVIVIQRVVGPVNMWRMGFGRLGLLPSGSQIVRLLESPPLVCHVGEQGSIRAGANQKSAQGREAQHVSEGVVKIITEGHQLRQVHV